jgi:hypothetical protein
LTNSGLATACAFIEKRALVANGLSACRRLSPLSPISHLALIYMEKWTIQKLSPPVAAVANWRQMPLSPRGQAVATSF